MEEAKRKLDAKKEKLQKEEDALEGVETEEAGLTAEEEKTTETSPQEQAPQEAKKERTVLNTPIWVAFSNLDDCISACHHLQSQRGFPVLHTNIKIHIICVFSFQRKNIRWQV